MFHLWRRYILFILSAIDLVVLPFAISFIINEGKQMCFICGDVKDDVKMA